jgi:phosphosulfolactate synthase (CoM biosynthesis protein A)
MAGQNLVTKAEIENKFVNEIMDVISKYADSIKIRYDYLYVYPKTEIKIKVNGQL